MEKISVIKDHLEKLNYVVAIAQSGSISAASKQLKLTQSAISHSMATLEQALGVELFVRKPSGVDLTDAGRILNEFGRRMLDDLEDIEKKIYHPMDSTAGKLRIGSHETISIHIFPTIMGDFLEEFPKLSVSLTGGRVDPLIKGVLEETYHLAITVEPLNHNKLNRVVLYSGTMGFFVGTHPLPRYSILKKKYLSLEEANSVPLLTDIDSHMRQGLPMPHALAAFGLSLRNLYALNSFEAAMRLAAQGVGIAFVAERNAKELVDKGVLRRIKVRGLQRQEFGEYTICASYLKKNRNHAAIESLITRMRKTLASPS